MSVIIELSILIDIIFEKFFVYLMMTNVIMKTCLKQKIIKNSNLHDAGNEEGRISESECYPKTEFFRKPNLSENLPNVPKCGLNSDTYSFDTSANFAH